MDKNSNPSCKISLNLYDETKDSLILNSREETLTSEFDGFDNRKEMLDEGNACISEFLQSSTKHLGKMILVIAMFAIMLAVSYVTFARPDTLRRGNKILIGIFFYSNGVAIDFFQSKAF